MVEEEPGAVVMGPEEAEQRGDQHDAADVPAHAQVVEPRRQPDAGDVDDDLGNHDEDHHQELEAPAGRGAEDRDGDVGGHAGDAGHRTDEVSRGGDVDAGGDRDLADHVEPGGDPRPRAAAEPERPEVEAARRRIGRGQLGHRGRDREGEKADDRPSDRADDRSRELEPVAEEQDGAGQDRDGRERDREVVKAAHLAEELLRVAEPGEVANVVGDDLLTGASRHPSRYGWGAADGFVARTNTCSTGPVNTERQSDWCRNPSASHSSFFVSTTWTPRRSSASCQPGATLWILMSSSSVPVL